MALKDIARELPEEIWAVFEPILPRVIWCGNGRPPKGNANASTPCSTSWSAASPGRCCRPASPRTNPPAAAQAVAGARRLPHRLARTGQAVRAARWDQLGSAPPRRLEEAVKKGGEQTGPSPVDRGKSGTALHLACDNRAMPLGVVITGANANDGCQAQDLLEALVIGPPQPEVPTAAVDPRGLPRARADGAYGNGPTRRRAEAAGFRLQAPGRGQQLPGVGRIRQAVERCPNFFAQFGRIVRRWDRSARQFLGWVELAACIIFIRSGFVR